jgi:hypothetical protein
MSLPMDSSVNSLVAQLNQTVKKMCDVETVNMKQACQDATRFQKALGEAGTFLVPPESDPWQILEGEALKRHPDPLGALQRGEVPALMLRRFVPREELDHMLSRMAQMAIGIFNCRFPSMTKSNFTLTLSASRQRRVISNSSYCVKLNSLSSLAILSWPHWCAFLTHLGGPECILPHRRTSPECIARQDDHPVFERCKFNNLKGRHRRRKTPVDAARGAAREFGQKLYGNLQRGTKSNFMRRATAIDGLHELLAVGCTGRYCSPKQAMLAGVAELVGPSRVTRQAQEDDLRHLGSADLHSPGTVRAMTKGWSTPLHMDSKHSSAWVALRKEICGEEVMESMGTEASTAARYHALTGHRFAASAIFTMHAPARASNPVDLRVFRTRFPGILRNCSVLTVDAYGVGVRFRRETFPAHILEQSLTITAEPGDLFLFNSEYFHDTPVIKGEQSRTVFNSFAGFSADGGPVELYA